MTTTTPVPRIVVPEDAPRSQWMEERGEGVTASEVWAIARGGVKTWRRILEGKMNGSRFSGNKATSAGHAREAALLDEAADRLATLTPNGALWAAAGNDLCRATPDGVGTDAQGHRVVVEVKSHEFGWDSDAIPPEHMGQMQWQMLVLDAHHALYGFEVRDEDDMPPADGATWIEVERDQEMIDWLAYRADQFIAWREAGCPDVDVLPESVAAALAEWAPLKAAADKAAAAERKANAAMKAAVAVLPFAKRFGAVGMGAVGGFQVTVAESAVIDAAAWEDGDPLAFDLAAALRRDLADLEASALARFPKVKSTTSLRFQEATNV